MPFALTIFASYISRTSCCDFVSEFYKIGKTCICCFIYFFYFSV